MKANRHPLREPLLNTMARKIGGAVGSITNAAQELTANISALPETVTTKVREAASPATVARRPTKKRARAAGVKPASASGGKRPVSKKSAARKIATRSQAISPGRRKNK